MNPIYTAGYGNKPVRSLVLAARKHDALVVDIRCSPRSKNPGFDQKELIASLDSRYHHLPQLGNVNYGTGGPIRLAHPENGIMRLRQMAHARTLIVLCGCGDLHSCHRSTVAAMLHERGVQTSELEWPTVPKLNLAGLTDTALSILQPWAWLIVNGFKSIENRTWWHKHRGPLLIHAGKGFDLEGWKSLLTGDYWRGIAPKMPKIGDFDRGGLVGYVNMTGCVTESESPWFFGEYGFTFKDAQPLPFMALPGARGFFSVSEQMALGKAPKVEGTVWVDELHQYGHGPSCFREGACHMTADNLDVLHAMAKRLGLKQEWFQSESRVPHYDLTVGKREQALKFGAVFKPAKEQVRERLAAQKEALQTA